MSQGFGHEVPAPHVQGQHREVTKYLIIVPAPEGSVAKLLLANRVTVAELDGNTEEVTAMIRSRIPQIGATGIEWDTPLAGYSVEHRAAAKVYTLEP